MTTWNFDHAGRVTRQQTQTGSSTIASDYTFGNAALGIPAVHVNTIVHSVNGTPLRTYAIGRTALGQVSTQTATDSSNNTMGSEAISYDLRGRVTGDTDHYQTNGTTAQYDSANAYTWDLSNNLMGGASGWTYNTSNQATSASAPSSAPGLGGGTGLAYDNSGNLTAMNGAGLSWDCWGHMSGAGAGAYTYDSAGRRVSKTVSGTTTFFLYAGGSLIAEVDSSGSLIRSYDWGPAGLISENSASGCRYYLFDGMGNTRFLLNAAGAVVSEAAYTAWGSTFSAGVIASPFGWKGQSGQYTDSETGLVYCNARYYAPALGRFISRDPISFAGGINVYAYCGGDPVNYADPSGLQGVVTQTTAPAEVEIPTITAPATEVEADTAVMVGKEAAGESVAFAAPQLGGLTFANTIPVIGELYDVAFLGCIAVEVYAESNAIACARPVNMATLPHNVRTIRKRSYACPGVIPSRMQTLDLTNSSWRRATFSQVGLVYVLRDSDTGELLKVGQSTSQKFIGRFEKYVTAGNRNNRNLALDVFETPLWNRGTIEGQIRDHLGGAPGSLPWDNAGQRLMRPGPGVP